MTRSITFNGVCLTLGGRRLDTDSVAPDFIVHTGDLKEVHLKDFEDKIKLITTFPSLDTPVCDLQVKEFNKRAAGLSKDVVVIAVSKDLPFAQKRFCNDFSIDHVLVFSDYNHSSFGYNYGLQINELNLLARSVMILDNKNVIRYIQTVDELSSQPDSGLTQIAKVSAKSSSGCDWA